MQLRDLVTLRRDLLFQGAVQIGWYETDVEKSQKAAENFVFHGPKYHGARERDFGQSQAYRLKDTVSFTLEILRQLGADGPDAAPMVLAAAGYGTGKSHLGLTLAVLLSGDFESSRERILENLKVADEELGRQIEFFLKRQRRPYLILAINGMQDFDLAEEIRRQILTQLRQRGFSTEVLDELRPRFQIARRFATNFFELLRSNFWHHFGEGCTKEEILALLEAEDEKAFRRVNAIYEAMMGQPIVAAGRESLQDFLGVFAREYCGREKAFQGLLIVFDEFGRYLEFAVQRPHVAGPQGLQQLFEAVQDNAQSIFLLCFLQSELRAYASRVPPELRDQLERFVTRYDVAPKMRLSTNLETIIANLIQKRDLPAILKILRHRKASEYLPILTEKLQRWFPQMSQHGLWLDLNRFSKVIQEGCWPLHPATTWILYSLTAVGKSFQQRSALSFLDEVIRDHEEQPMDGSYWSMPPVALCTDGIIAEFKISEDYGDSDAIAHAFEEARSRFQNELDETEQKALKAVLLSAKTGLSVVSEKDFMEAAAVLTGKALAEVEQAFNQLVKEYGILEWNEALRRYDIVGDAVPRRVFLRVLAERVQRLNSERRASLFRIRSGAWTEIDRIQTDYGRTKKISTAEWHFAVTFTNVATLAQDLKQALKAWADSYAVDQCRGQALFCYVGPESNIEEVRETARQTVADALCGLEKDSRQVAPLAVIFVNDEDGGLGRDLAEYWVLEEGSGKEDFSRFTAFITDHKRRLRERIVWRVGELLERVPAQDFIAGCSTEISNGRTKAALERIFDAVYPDLIPFPFDGFYTARGNAAKDCMQFTRDLFQGNVNQTAIAAYGAQQRNRAVNVLHKAWNIFLSDGNVSRRPGNHRVALLIDFLENSLHSAGRLNLGEALRILCRPPFGCNLASAGLALGVFFAPRRNDIRLCYRGEIKGPEEWLGVAVQGNFFKLNELDETEFQSVGEGEPDFWKHFLDNWELETTYEGRVALYERAVAFAEERPVPPGLRDRWELRRRDAEEAKRHLEHYQKTLEEQRGYAAKAYERGNSGVLARCACTFLDLLQRMREGRQVWTEEQMKVVEEELASCKVGALQHFETWLPEQVEKDPMQYSRFQLRMTKTAENFEKLRLNRQAQRLREQLDKVTEDLDNLQRLKTIFEEVDTFLAGVRIGPSSKVMEIRNTLNRIAQLEAKIQEAFRARMPVLPLDETWDRLQRLKKSCERQLKAHQDRAEAIWNRTLDSIDDVRETAQEVRTLITLYDGLEADLEDFRLMHRVLNLVEEHHQHMNSLSISSSELNQRYEKAVRDTKGLLGQDDEIPWSIDETLGKIKEKIEKTRRESAEEWMKQQVPPLDRLPTMQGEEVARVRRHLNTAPPYLTHHQLETVRLTLEACSRRLEDLAVDGLVAQFEELSPEAQKEFLRRALQIAESGSLRTSANG